MHYLKIRERVTHQRKEMGFYFPRLNVMDISFCYSSTKRNRFLPVTRERILCMKRKSGRYKLILATLFLLCVGIAITWKKSPKKELYTHVGIAVYNLDDTFMESYIQALQNEIEERKIAGKKISYEIYDAEGSSRRQEKQLQYMYAQNYDIMLVNLVEPASAASVLNEAQESGVPVILFNREVVQKDLEIMNDVWYVGTDAEKAGEIQGEMLSKIWNERGKKLDKNKNGKLDYVLIEGEEEHYDTIRRTKGFLESSEKLPLNQQANLSADWNRELAFEKFSRLDEKTIQNTEAVICNNDDMALGIYDYYQKQHLELPIILGINNSQEMNEKIMDRQICGTVDNNMKDQVDQIYKLMQSILDKDAKKYQKVWYSKPYAVINTSNGN